MFKNTVSKKKLNGQLFLLALPLLIALLGVNVSLAQDVLDLSGDWKFKVDPSNLGVNQKWYNQHLEGKIKLPGSMTTNGIGNEVTLNTPWTGIILDSSYYKEPQYAKYREPDNIKVPFWLQPVKYYKGIAWYQKTIEVPKSFENKSINLFFERPHWQSTVWVDGKNLGSKNSLGTPHQFLLNEGLEEGKHTITIRIDNGIHELKVGESSHSISDNTQGNWNGIIGKMELQAVPKTRVENVQIYPDIKNKEVVVKLKFTTTNSRNQNAILAVSASSSNPSAEKLSSLTKEIKINGFKDSLELTYPMGQNPLLWDEFHPNLYTLNVSLKTKSGTDQTAVDFGMREFRAEGIQLLVNSKPIFLRGTLDCASYPITGYPPTDIESWLAIFKKIKSYGLNHVRYHSWTPPKAAFQAADKLGFYLQVECSSWASDDARIGGGLPLDKWLYEESNRLKEEYGNHPSFMMMAYGNEPKGENQVAYLTKFVKYWQAKDSRRLYTTGAGWPIVAESDFDNPPNPRIQRWGEALKSIINAEPPKSNYNWTNRISNSKNPTVSHEIGQWCVYPNFDEIKDYTGVLKPKNFEIFEDRLKENDLYSLADSFVLASGKLQVLCYKADIEAALRTPKFGGFQLLGLNDFPGQGTALVGVLDVFWKDKSYTSASEFSEFCSPTVPLALFPKFIYSSNEALNIPVKLAHFGAETLNGVTPTWNIKDSNGKILFYGELTRRDLPLGNNIDLGSINQPLSTLNKAEKLQLNINIADGHNSWDFFVYPVETPNLETPVLTAQRLDENAMAVLNKGGNVLLTLKKGELVPEMGGDVKIGFSSIFWNTAYTNGQAPNTLGILCDPNHPAFDNFPTDYHSNWQWWDGMTHANVIRLDAISKDLKPIVRVIDDWYTANSLGLIFECKVGNGKLLISGIDLLTDYQNRPVAKQLLYSLKNYMNSEKFNPEIKLETREINSLYSN